MENMKRITRVNQLKRVEFKEIKKSTRNDKKLGNYKYKRMQEADPIKEKK